MTEEQPDRWIRVKFGVAWRGYAAGQIYDVEISPEILALLSNSLAVHVPYPDVVQSATTTNELGENEHG